MSRARSIWLVARREILERGRSRGFIFSVVLTSAIVIGSIVLPAMLAGDGTVKLGIVEPAPAGLQAAIESTAAAYGQKVSVTTYPSAAAADQALADGSVDAVVSMPADLSGPGTVRFHKQADPAITRLVATATVGLRVQAVVGASDIDPGALASAQQPPAVETSEPQNDFDESRFAVANIGAIAILIGIFTFGYAVLTGVVEEKQSRVVEVVLSTVAARDLLMGKVLGIGILGIVQLAFFLVAALVAVSVTGRIEIPTTTPAAAGLLVVWFVLGYTLYATTLGFVGSLASRTEEATNAATPVQMLVFVSYFGSIFAVIDDPSGTFATILSLLPVSAPFAVPLRAAYDAIPPWQIGLSVIITVVTIWVLFVVGARVYSGAVLQMGGRMRLRDAWRSAGE